MAGSADFDFENDALGYDHGAPVYLRDIWPSQFEIAEAMRTGLKSEMFTKMRKHMDRRRLLEMGELMAAAKKIAPTHPHPHAPATPPGNLVTGAAAGVMDRARDALREARRSRT